MPYQKFKRGIIPLFILIAVGIVFAAAGGAYIVRKEFLKTGKSGKTALDVEKVRQQIAKPANLPTPSPESIKETVSGPITYIPPSPSPGSKASIIPQFTISPPSGWLKGPTSQATVLALEAPEEDHIPQEEGSGLTANGRATIFVQFTDLKQKVDLNVLVDALKEDARKTHENAQFLSQNTSSLNGHEAIILENKLMDKGVWLHSIDFIMVEGNYGVIVNGASFEEKWSNWSQTMKSSIETFSFKK